MQEIDFFDKDPAQLAEEIVPEVHDEYYTPEQIMDKIPTIESSFTPDEEFRQNCDRAYKRLVKDIRSHVRGNNDIIICVDGREGQGKTKFGVFKLAMDLDSQFNWKTQVLLRPTPDTLEKTIFAVPKYSVVLVDEAMDVLYKRRSGTSESIGIVQLFARVRKFNRIVILILPDFNDLDIFFRKRRVQVRAKIITRGLGYFSIARDFEGMGDPWFSDYNSKVAEDSLADLDINKATAIEKLSVYEQFRGFYAPFTWTDTECEKSVWDEYEDMAMKSTLEANLVAKKQEDIGIYEKKYRYLFSALARVYMKEHKIDVKALHKELLMRVGADLVSADTLTKTIEAFEKVKPVEKKQTEKIDLDALG
jgi:hypothetical protein